MSPVLARLLRVLREGPRPVVARAALRVVALLAPAHRTNASGNNQSQR